MDERLDPPELFIKFHPEVFIGFLLLFIRY